MSAARRRPRDRPRTSRDRAPPTLITACASAMRVWSLRIWRMFSSSVSSVMRSSTRFALRKANWRHLSRADRAGCRG